MQGRMPRKITSKLHKNISVPLALSPSLCHSVSVPRILISAYYIFNFILFGEFSTGQGYGVAETWKHSYRHLDCFTGRRGHSAYEEAPEVISVAQRRCCTRPPPLHRGLSNIPLTNSRFLKINPIFV